MFLSLSLSRFPTLIKWLRYYLKMMIDWLDGWNLSLSLNVGQKREDGDFITRSTTQHMRTQELKPLIYRHVSQHFDSKGGSFKRNCQTSDYPAAIWVLMQDPDVSKVAINGILLDIRAKSSSVF